MGSIDAAEGAFIVYVAIPATIAAVGAIEAIGNSEHQPGQGFHNESAPKPAAANDGSKKAPTGNNGNTDTPHGSPEHDAAVNKEIQKMKDQRYTDIRKNRTAQTDAQGNKVGNNRPDAQGTNP